MPIYAYRCEDCGHAQDFLQKISDPLIDVCPSCASKNFRKQVTAAGFQLKGGGWYVTDFRDGGKKPAEGAAKGEPKSDAKDGSKSASESGTKSDTGDGKAAAPAATPAAGTSASTPSSGGDSKVA